MDIKVRNSNGALLAEGDSVTLIKDLKLEGSSTVLKRDRRPQRQGQGPGAARGVFEEGVRGLTTHTSSPAKAGDPVFQRHQ
jgi:hypothetical protein